MYDRMTPSPVDHPEHRKRHVVAFVATRRHGATKTILLLHLPFVVNALSVLHSSDDAGTGQAITRMAETSMWDE
jgi:hypothetical protein